MAGYFVFGLISGYGQRDCSTAVAVCTDANSGGVVYGLGMDDFNGLTESGCLKTSQNGSTIEENSYWFRVKLTESGEFGFNITPQDISEDWDFAVYGPNATCGALTSPIACNYVGGIGGVTGVGDTTGDPNDPFAPWLNVTAGDEYYILVNQYSGNLTGFTITWTGALIDNFTDPLDCTELVELGPAREFCEGEATTLNAAIFGADVSYTWSKLNSISGLYEPLGISDPSISINTTGNYKVEVVDNSKAVTYEDTIQITFHAVPNIVPVGNLQGCDFNNEGQAEFDLEQQTIPILNGQPDMKVTYHETAVLAHANQDALTSPFTSNGQIIWARIENNARTNCYEITSFELVLATPMIAYKPPDLYGCDNNNDGFMFFDLEQQTAAVLNGQTGVVTYYVDEIDAMDPKGWIIDPMAYKTGSVTIYVRVEPVLRSECYALTSFEIYVNDTPIAFPTNDIKECDLDNDGLYSFDFNGLKDADILGGQDPDQYEVVYYSSQSDANNQNNPLPNPYTNSVAYGFETIVARIQNKNYDGCFDTTSFTLQVFDTPYPLNSESIPDLVYCDDMSDGNDSDGFFNFDLTERETTILNGQSPFVFELTYFEDPGHFVQIADPTDFRNRNSYQDQEIYVLVSNRHPNNESCIAETSFTIRVQPLPEALLAPYDFVQCDADGVIDGVVDFVLSYADVYVTLGDINLNVSYHISAIDADTGSNPLDKTSFSNSVSPVIFARVASDLGCYRVVQVNLVVAPAETFPPNYIHEIVVCDNDGSNEGIYAFNLSQATSEIISLFSGNNLRVGYFRNQSDALYNVNAINTTSAYLNETPYSQTLWVRVESAEDGSCAAVAPVVQLTVNNIPEFDLDESAYLCYNNLPLTVSVYNETGNFNYVWRDEVGDIISYQPYAEISQEGVYTVVAQSILNCESFPRQITILPSEVATIDANDISIIENSENNSITVNSTGTNLGIGDYEFSLNAIDGPYQDDSTFYNIPPGEHTVFVRDKNGCGIAQAVINVLGFPKFFTPNDDGINDTWNIRGVKPGAFVNSTIVIFDRYGKMLARFGIFDLGWDGFYNNNQMNASDYWYLAELEDLSGQITVYKGHFSLLR